MVCATTLAGAAPTALQSTEAVGTQFKVTLADGRVLLSPELVGAILTVAFDGAQRRIRIDAVETDPGLDPARPSPDVFLHTLSIETADGAWQNICKPGPDGRRQAFPLAGRGRADATIGPGDAGNFEITCSGGAQGKCIRFGYRPWRDAPGGLAPYDLFNACVRMVRADYSGDGKGTTLDGQLIDLYDFSGIQPDDVPSGMDFEAGWSKDGAVCVRHVRVKQNVSLGELEMLSSLRGRTGDICTEQFARTHGAIIFNRSRP